MLTREGHPQSLLLFTVPPFLYGWLRIGIGSSLSMPVITRLLLKMVINFIFFLLGVFFLDLRVWVLFFYGFSFLVFVEFADLLHILSYLPKDLNFVNHTSYLGWKEYVNFIYFATFANCIFGYKRKVVSLLELVLHFSHLFIFNQTIILLLYSNFIAKATKNQT